jgi:hypothetical protein
MCACYLQFRGHPRYGYLLENDGMVQAVLLALSAQFGDGLPRINFSTWCARPTYRPAAILLQTRAMRQKAELYLNLSAAEHTVPILKVEVDPDRETAEAVF